MRILGFATFVIFCSLSSINGFGNGPPWKMCSIMIPKHSGLQQQQTEAPYVITLSKGNYNPNDVIQITITSNAGTTPFKGFILGARPLNGDTENVVGKFIDPLPAGSKGSSWYAQDGENVPNCVSHSNNNDKTSLTFSWQAPSTTVGDIIFSSAFVQNYRTFWANVSSSPLRTATAVTLPPFLSAVNPGFTSMDLDHSCGKDKGCVLYPKYCTPSNCEWVVAYKKVGDTHVDFEMIGISSGYISLGLSDDRLMTNDSTITCTLTQDKLFSSVQNGYNPAYNNERHRIIGFTNIQLTRFDNKIYCRFRRPIDVDLTLVSVNRSNIGKYSQLTFSLREPWYVFLALGGLYQGTDVLGKHVQEPLVTPVKVNLLGSDIIYPSVFPLMVHLHGTFMLMAWMLSAGLGIILAGHFKDLITKMACGSQLWVQLHKGVMVSVAVFTVIGLILILVFQGGWIERGTTHGAVGLSAAALMVIQIFIGIIRPAPDSKRRPIFKWAHTIMGYTTLRLSATAFLLAFVMSHIPPTLRLYNTIVFGCWMGIQIIWEMIFRYISWRFQREMNNAVVSTDLKNVQMQSVAEGSSEFMKKKKCILFTALFCYVVTLVIFFCVSIAFFYIF